MDAAQVDRLIAEEYRFFTSERAGWSIAAGPRDLELVAHALRVLLHSRTLGDFRDEYRALVACQHADGGWAPQSDEAESTVWEALALANLLVALALDRRYAYQSVGALGAIELTAPGRVAQVDRGLSRLGVAKASRRYFTLHATLDVQHSAAWNREVLRPLVAREPRAAQAIAEGALMRLRAGARCFARYRRELGLEPAQLLQDLALAP